ncbi:MULTISPECIES: exodeoxyribonuclease VII large subunit [unclassified Modicisalibacter]|uniref:exodeoxyribonuclease VII large subunit n=1 Tax=unclassified Modicisalibacter TaxID=2679913 RepID=UPI001CC9A1BA|nr:MULTISPECIES: exodeoxyribonuclease VII large subunit [unclassified Modicisalibacter]MBZ9559477.1 exodeoxyribonuclease VII large subunit [Modicisalibacter sp. R2A 31.J]MBZ9576929.1 exodeoxyribonuclease VII large subunit [Modicisalibacter sp. MOD 31.J]
MPDATDAALSVSELNRRARQMLERGFGECWVEGEISSLARPASGHVYFTLKDDRAQVKCALFRNRARFTPALNNGDQVRLRGKVSLFEPRGDYQLIVEAVQPAGQGALLAAFERLKRQLAGEGVFANQRPLPYPPRHLAVISSPTGAAIRDVLAVLAARWPALPVTLLPVAVQGREAAPAIIRAIAIANRLAESPGSGFDAILVTRGGGSLEDLWAFNDEHLARAIFHSRLPVMAAVGHEVDVTLADFAADVRAPTPSAAAEQLVPDQRDRRRRLSELRQRLANAQQGRLEAEAQRLDHLRARLRHPGERLAQQRQRLDQLEGRLHRALEQRLTGERRHLDHLRSRLAGLDPGRHLTQARRRLDALDERLHAAMPRQIEQRRANLAALVRELQAVSPLAVLGRGYAILENADGTVIKRAGDTRPGETLKARLGEGRLSVEVKRRYKR